MAQPISPAENASLLLRWALIDLWLIVVHSASPFGRYRRLGSTDSARTSYRPFRRLYWRSVES